MATTRDVYKIITTQAFDFTSTSGSTTAFTDHTYAVRLSANAPVNFRIFDVGQSSSTCTSADPLLPATWFTDAIGVTPGQKISAIKGSGGTLTSADGRLWIQELAL